MLKSLIIFAAGIGTGIWLSSQFKREAKTAIVATAVESAIHVPVVAPKARPRLKKAAPTPRPVVDANPVPEHGVEICARSVSEYLGTRPAFGEITCRCPAEFADYGSVWGTGLYTTDSSLCRAAKHAGRWRDDGDEVTVYLKPGLARYDGSESDGVKSDDYGSWESSFSFYP